MLDKADHVVTKVSEQPGGGGRQVGRKVDPAFGDHGTEGIQGRTFDLIEIIAVEPRLSVDPRGISPAFPNEIRLQADNGIAAADLATGNRFKDETVLSRLGSFSINDTGVSRSAASRA